MIESTGCSLIGICAGLVLGAIGAFAGSYGSSTVGSMSVFPVFGLLSFLINWLTFIRAIASHGGERRPTLVA